MELKQFYNKVSPSLQSKITHCLFNVVIMRNSLFNKHLHCNKELEKELDLIGRMFQPIECVPEDVCII